MNVHVDTLTSSQLSSFIVAAERRLQLLNSRRPASVVRRELEGLAALEGYTVADLFNAPSEPRPARKAAKRKKAKVAPKYRNPDDARQTWTGRGRAPTWLAEKVKRGQSATDFLIPGLARPTAKKSSAVGRRTVFKKA